jgi:hypothetical protein
MTRTTAEAQRPPLLRARAPRAVAGGYQLQLVSERKITFLVELLKRFFLGKCEDKPRARCHYGCSRIRSRPRWSWSRSNSLMATAMRLSWTMHYRSPLRSAMQPDRISLGPVHPRPYDLFPLARQREHVLAIDQLHQCRPVTCISRVVMRWASADVTVSNITVPIRSSFFTSVFLLLEINRTPN